MCSLRQDGASQACILGTILYTFYTADLPILPTYKDPQIDLPTPILPKPPPISMSILSIQMVQNVEDETDRGQIYPNYVYVKYDHVYILTVKEVSTK